MRSIKQLRSQQLQAYAQLSDQEVISRILQGDNGLFELIMRRYNSRLYRACYGILQNNQTAEDAVQESYLSAYHNLRQFRGPNGFAAWLTKICVRTAYGILRRDNRLQTISDDMSDSNVPESEADSHTDPEANLRISETTLLLEQAINSLPRDYRLVYLLRDLEGLSEKETAAALEIDLGTVKSRTHRARQLVRHQCRQQLGSSSGEPFAFAGARCDRIVRTVFSRLNETQASN